MNKSINILVVEDDNDINLMISKLIEKCGYNVVQAFSGTEALLHIDKINFDLVLLDLMLPGMNGEELLKNIREKYRMPVIVISARLEREVKVQLLKIGADDYVTKPFDLDELEARIEANLRRYKHYNEESLSQDTIIYNDITINKETKEVFVNDNSITLTAIEFKILQLLMSHPKKVFSKNNILESIWGDAYIGDDNTVNVHMSNLRTKLQKHSDGKEYIETIWGMGYKLKP